MLYFEKVIGQKGKRNFSPKQVKVWEEIGSTFRQFFLPLWLIPKGFGKVPSS